MTDFETWWYNEGSSPKLHSHDHEEHCKRMCEIAWSNGAYKERERAALKVEELGMIGYCCGHSTRRSGMTEPFGYFKAEPFGWTDCAATDEGAVALYEHPKEWAGLTREDMPDGEDPIYDDPRFIAGMVWAANKLWEKNNG